MESDHDESESKSESESRSESEDGDEREGGGYEDPESEEEKSLPDQSESDDDQPGIDTVVVEEKIVKKSKPPEKRKGKEISMKLKDLNEQTLKSLALGKLKNLASKYNLDVKDAIDPTRVRKTPIKLDYINLLLYHKSHNLKTREESIEDAGEDAEDTNVLPDKKGREWVRGGGKWVLDKKMYSWATTANIRTLVKKGIINRESLYYDKWVDSRFAKRPQHEKNVEMQSFGGGYYIPLRKSMRNRSTGEIKIIGDDPSHGRTMPLNMKSESRISGPPLGYKSFRVRDRVSFAGKELYKGFLTKAEIDFFYISGVKEPFYYEKIDGLMPIAIPAPESSSVISKDEEQFTHHIRHINEHYPAMTEEYYVQLKYQPDKDDPNSPIVGLVLDKDRYSWVYDFTMDPEIVTKRLLIPVAWDDQPVNYDSITQYVSVIISGTVDGTVIGYTTNGVMILTDQGERENISFGDPSLKIIPSKGDQKDPSIPTKKDILCSSVTPDMRLAVITKLFNNFANVIPGLFEERNGDGEEENVPSPFITVFRTQKEYFYDQFFIWLRAKYRPMIIKDLPFDKLKQEAYKKATMGLGINNLDMIHNVWGIDLVNSLDENYKNRLTEWGIYKNNPRSFFHLSRDFMLRYLKDAKNKTVFEIEIESGLYKYEPYQPPQPSEVFTLGEKVFSKKQMGIASKNYEEFLKGSFIPPEMEGEMEERRFLARSRIEKTQLAEALTRMTRSFMFQFPLSEDKIFEELVEGEFNKRYNKLVPLSRKEKFTRTKDGVDRISIDFEEFFSTHGQKLEELYKNYENSWGEKLNNPGGKVGKIIKEQKIMSYFQDQLDDLRDKEVELTQDLNIPGKVRVEYNLLPEEKRVLDMIKGDREILKNDIMNLEQEIQILGSSPRTGLLSLKGYAVRAEIKQFERDCMVLAQKRNTTEGYLMMALYPLIFISIDSNVSRYSNVFRSKIADRTYSVDSLLNSDLFHYFPEFCMKDNSDEIETNGKSAILNVLNYIVTKFAQNFIDAKYLGPRRIKTMPENIDLGFDWKTAIISPQQVCEKQTGSGKTLVRDKYEEKYYKKLDTTKIPVKDYPWLEKRIVTETETPRYETIEDGNLIIDRNPGTNKFTCHSKPEIILQIAVALIRNPRTKIIVDPRTEQPYSTVFINRMKKRYEKEINHAIENLPANFVLDPIPKRSRVISETIYNAKTGRITEIEKDDEGEMIIESKPWTDLSSFLEYIKPRGKVLVLFCSNMSTDCNKFKGKEWVSLKSEYPRITFLDIDIQGITHGGSDIATEYKSMFVKAGQLVMKVPSIFLFNNGRAIGRSSSRVDKIRELIRGEEESEEEEIDIPPEEIKSEEVEEIKSEEVEEIKSEEVEEIKSEEEAMRLWEEIKSVEEEDIESEEEGIDILWHDLKSFLDYIKPKGNVMALFCNTRSKCVNFKKNWVKLAAKNKNIMFLEVDGPEQTYIINFIKGKKNTMKHVKVPIVVLFMKGKPRGTSAIEIGGVKELIDILNKRKK